MNEIPGIPTKANFTEEEKEAFIEQLKAVIWLLEKEDGRNMGVVLACKCRFDPAVQMFQNVIWKGFETSLYKNGVVGIVI